jgi:ADP-ribose pyrophosphatase YjhB (NUDIX family)
MHNYDTFCNNCGKNGHQFYQCKIPITSFGVIAFRKNPECGGEYEYLMIRRRDTLGYIDFMRGKYTLNNSHYIINMMKQMTIKEKERLRTSSFPDLWENLWGGKTISQQYAAEEASSMEKYNSLKLGTIMNSGFCTLDTLLDESMQYPQWEEPEWGFPKGRRNNQEKDYDCAIREFSEETGYSPHILKNVHNILPFEEIFSGSNYKSYKHKYYLMYIAYDDSLHLPAFEKTEVSDIGWKKIDQCISCIRPYNLEKIRIIQKIHFCLMTHQLYFS